jgi:hypothetical protein
VGLTNKNKQWRLITGCSLLGLLITAFFVVCIDLYALDLNLVVTFVILCPPSLLSSQFSQITRDSVGFYAIWLLIGIANAGLYAIIGAAIAGVLWKLD